MRRARVLAFPSRQEAFGLVAFGLVAFEAMQCGVPVVYTTASAGPEVVEDGVTGLTEDHFSPEDVARKTLQILQSACLAQRLVENARRSVEKRFSLERCVDESVSFYNTCRKVQ